MDNFNKKRITRSISLAILLMIVNFGLGFNESQVTARAVLGEYFVWGYQLMWEPCSQWWDIDHRICRESSGGFCQVSAQTTCPGPPYMA